MGDTDVDTDNGSQERIIRTIQLDESESFFDRPKSSISITKKPNTLLGSAVSERAGNAKSPKTPVRPMTPYKDQGASQHILDFHKALSEYMENQGFSDQFPSQNLLHKVAEEYRTLDINWPEDEDGIVCPCPPSCTKSEHVNDQRMLEMDKRALSIPAAFLKRPLFEVVQYLIEPAENEVEIARAIYRWITAQNLDDVTVDNRSLASLPGDYACVLLRRVKMGQINYSDMFGDMAGYANIECIKIDGVRKTFPKKPCQTVYHLKDWKWVAVFLEGHWRLVDCHMGAICWQETKGAINVDDSDAENEAISSGGGDQGSRNKDQQKSLTSFLNDFYFLTNPEDLILSHFPNKEYCQFLARPVKNSEFMDMPFLKPHYLFYAIHATEKEKLDVQAQQGKVFFELRTRENLPLKLSYRLRKVFEDEIALKTKRLEDFVFLENNQKNGLVKIAIKLPERGQYVFDLFGKSSADPPVTQMNHLCSYRIRCSSTDLAFDEYPHNDLMEWGPGVEAKVSGMTPVSHFEGRVNTVDGKAEIIFDVSKPLLFDQKLEKKKASKEYLDGYALNRTENGQVIFTVTPPKEGDFCLKIYAKEENEESNFRNVCIYLVHCSNVLDIPIPYPKDACGRVGVKNASDRLGLELISPRSAVIYVPEDGRITLRFIASKPVILLHKLHFFGQNGDTEEFPDNVTQSRQNKNILLRLKFPRYGLYHFSLLGRSVSGNGNFVQVYNAVIHCNWPVRELMPKPRYLAAWKSNYKLHSPKQRHLPAKTNVFFAMTIPGATDVVVNTVQQTQHLLNKGDDLWESFIETGKSGPGSTLEVTACMNTALRSYSALVEFKVLSESEITSKHEKQEENYQRALKRIHTLEREGKWRAPPRQTDVMCDDDEDDTLPLIALHNSEVTPPGSDDHLVQITPDDITRAIRKTINKDGSTTSSTKTGASNNQKKNKKSRYGSHVSDEEMETLTTSPASGNSPSTTDSVTLGMQASVDGSGDTEISFKLTGSSSSYSSSTDSDSDSDEEFVQWKKSEKLQRALEERESIQNESHKVRVTLLKNRLRANIKRKDKLGLKAAVADSQEDNIAVHTIEYAQATRTMSMLSLRDEMKDYISKKDLIGLRNTISSIERRGFALDIPHDLAQAKASLRWMQKTTRTPPKSGIIDIPTLAEINRYHKPPAIVHRMFMAVLLLMGVHEGITKKWKRCRKMCVMFGSVGLNKRVRHMKINEINPLIAARSREILECYIPEEADSVSPGVGALYRWTREVVESVLVDFEEVVIPARKKQQKKIFKEEKIVRCQDFSLPDIVKRHRKKHVAKKPTKI